MQAFPIFLSLRGRRAVVVGGTEAAARKTELLLAAGADVRLFATDPCGELRHWIEDRRIAWTRTAFDEASLDGVALVIAAAADDDVNARASRAAQARGLPVNVVDRPALSSFIMPAIVDRDPVTIAISTGGSAPSLARLIRARIEQTIPPAIGRLAVLAREARAQVARVLRVPAARRRFWDEALQGRVAELALAGDMAAARRALMRQLASGSRSTGAAGGMVHLVGAGPGDPELLTLKAHRLLQGADVIVYDRLVAPEIIAMARRDAERIYVGKRRGDHCVPQSEINDTLVALARDGRSVVRLKGGDPFVFGRGGEEIDALLAAGIPVEVVPGITAALGCAASTGIPLTHRDHAQACVFVTGHLREGELDLDWEMLARPRQTVVIYMGATALAVLGASLTRHGLPETTPVALIENGTTARERRVVGTLATIAQQARASNLSGPTLCVIGMVVSAALSRDQQDAAGLVA
jgi:uroporphyrin-III C-methyltransferase/precorrin-2 dehydrogenase/sirohydrochlorin ferrochelatase